MHIASPTYSLAVALQKWSKGKTNDRLDNAVLFEKAAYDAAVKGIPALKLITTATVSDKFKVCPAL